MRRAAVWVTPLLILTLAVGAIGCGPAEETTPTGNGTATEVIAEARVAMSEVQSYRVETTVTYTVPDRGTHQGTSEWKFIFPDRHWVRTNSDDGSWGEYIASGDRQYIRSSDARYWQVLPLESSDPGGRSTGVVVPVDDLAFLEKLRDLEILADEEIDGVECFHYRGKLEGYVPSGEGEVELWIGIEDYLIRKLKSVARYPETGPGGKDVSATYTNLKEYHDFNGSGDSWVIPTVAEEMIGVGVDEEFTIQLDVTLRLGQDWYEEHDESMLALTGKEYVGAESPGIGGAREFRFRALQAGRTDITCTRKFGGNGPVFEQRIFMVEID